MNIRQAILEAKLVAAVKMLRAEHNQDLRLGYALKQLDAYEVGSDGYRYWLRAALKDCAS